MKNILIIGQKSKLAFEDLKKTSHKKINKTLIKKIVNKISGIYFFLITKIK